MSVIMVGASPMSLTHIENHTHNLWEIVVNIQGHGITYIGEETFEFGEGTIVCQPPNIPHSKYSQEGFVDIFLQPIDFPLGEPWAKKGIAVLQDDSEKNFETLIRMALQIYHKREGNDQTVLNALYKVMYHMLEGWYHKSPEHREIDRIKNLMVHAFTDPNLSVSALLDTGAYSRDHLRRLFQEITGQTPLSYLTHLRIAYAKRLLEENHLLHYRLGEIGNMSGYEDNRYFSRIFKKETGFSPSAYAEFCLEHRP